MDPTLRQKLLCYLGGAALSVAAGSPAAAQPELAAIPETVIVDLLDDIEEEGWQTRDTAHLMELLAEDPRQQVRSRALDCLKSLQHDQSSEETERLFLQLAQTNDRVVRHATVERFSEWLESRDPLDRLRVVTEWATSEHVFAREVIAGVMGHRLQTLGAEWVTDHLAVDPSHRVRKAAILAAESRFPENPMAYGRLIQRLTVDKDRRVRKVARKLARERMKGA